MKLIIFGLLFTVLLFMAVSPNAFAFPPSDTTLRILVVDSGIDDETGAIKRVNVAGFSQGLFYFDPSGNDMEFPVDVAVDSSGFVFVINDGTGVIVIDPDTTDPTTGHLLESTFPAPPGGFGALTGIAVDSNRNVFISDSTGAVFKYVEDSGNDFIFDKKITDDGVDFFNSPQDVAIDPFGSGDDQLFVLDLDDIYLVDHELASPTLTPVMDSGFEDIEDPLQMAISADDVALVTTSDTLFSVTLVISSPFGVETAFEDYEPGSLHGVLFDPVEGDIYVTDRFDNSLRFFDGIATTTVVYSGPPWIDILGIALTNADEVFADLKLEKSGPSFAVPGQQITYDITVSVGSGDDTVTDAQVTDRIVPLDELTFVDSVPSGCTVEIILATNEEFVLCNIPSISAGNPYQLALNYMVSTGTPEGGVTITNTATVTSEASEGVNVEPNSDSTTLVTLDSEVEICFGQTLEDFLDDGTNIVLGTPGNDVLTGTVGEQDVILGFAGDDVITGLDEQDCLVGGDGDDDLFGDDPSNPTAGEDDEIFGDDPNDPSASGDDQLFGHGGDDLLDGGPNAIIGDLCLGGEGTNTIINCEDTGVLTLTIVPNVTFTIPSPPDIEFDVPAASELNYDITLTNDGLIQLTLISFTMDIDTELQTFVGTSSGPAEMVCTLVINELTCDSFNPLDIGESITFTVLTFIEEDTVDEEVNNDSSATALETNDVSIDITGQIEAPTADLSITKDDTDDPVSVGDNIEYTLQIINAGPSYVTIQVDDVFTSEISFVGSTSSDFVCPVTSSPVICTATSLLAPGTYTIILDFTADVAGVATDTVTVSSTNIEHVEIDPSNNSDVETTTIEEDDADVVITKEDSVGGGPVSLGDEFFYTVKVTNNGPGIATDVEVEDVLPGELEFVSLVNTGFDSCGEASGTVTCEIAILGDGDMASVEINVKVVGTIGPNLVTNGSFEYPVVAITSDAGWQIYTSNEVDWDVDWIKKKPCKKWTPGSEVDGFLELQDNTAQTAGLGPAQEGIQWAELDSDCNGPGGGNVGKEKTSVKITQEIITDSGELYELSYASKARPSTSSNTNGLKVKLNGDQINEISPMSTDWEVNSHQFTAGGVSTIQFIDIGKPDSLGTFLDNVSLNIISLPEFIVNTATVVWTNPSGSQGENEATAETEVGDDEELFCGRPESDFNVIEGTSGNDKIWGTNYDDLIFGFEGRDKIFAKGGDDCVFAGPDNDLVFAGHGDDEVHGESGNDRIFGLLGNDVLFGEEGNDRIFAGKGNDEVDGGPGNDRIYAGKGNDEVDGGPGNDRIHAGKGNDEVNGGSGNDKIFGNSGEDMLSGNSGDDKIFGNKGDDFIDGGEDFDFCKGGQGDDTIVNCEKGDPNTGDPPAEVLLDFEENYLEHGTIVKNQFKSSHGVKIRVHNHGDGPDLGVIFDSTLTGTNDPDLEDPWSAGNINTNTILHHLLIIQENEYGHEDGVVDEPDDEAGGGDISLEFEQEVCSINSFDLIDIEMQIEEPGSIELIDGDNKVEITFEELEDSDLSIVFGDNSANKITNIDLEGLGLDHIHKMIFNLGGSGAIDNVAYSFCE